MACRIQICLLNMYAFRLMFHDGVWFKWGWSLYNTADSFSRLLIFLVQWASLGVFAAEDMPRPIISPGLVEMTPGCQFFPYALVCTVCCFIQKLLILSVVVGNFNNNKVNRRSLTQYLSTCLFVLFDLILCTQESFIHKTVAIFLVRGIRLSDNLQVAKRPSHIRERRWAWSGLKLTLSLVRA